MNAVAKTSPATGYGLSLMPSSMDQAMRLAEIMAQSKMVPKHLQGDLGTCFMVIEQAIRWNMSPFAVAQCTSNIGGRLMYEGKLVAAVASACNSIIGEFEYTFAGDPARPASLSVIASATRASDGQRKEVELRWADAKTDNQFWAKQPEQQLCYAAARVWCRRWSPGPMLGVYAPEEFPDNFKGTTVDASATPTPPAADAETEQPKRTWRSLLNDTAGMLSACHDVAGVVAVADLAAVRAALEKGPAPVPAEMKALLAEAFDRVRPSEEEEALDAEDDGEADPSDEPLDTELADAPA